MIWGLAGALIIILFILVRITTGRRQSLPEKPPEPVPPGNVSIFMDIKGNMHIIPFAMDKLKNGRASEYPVTLTVPYSSQEAGTAVRKGLGLSDTGKSLSSEDLMKNLGYYDWKDYSKEKKSVSVTCKNAEVVLNSTIRRPDGSFVFRIRGYERVLPDRLPDKALGEAVLELMKLSR
ncbi:MAG: hypothetical protein KBA53_06740 [Thermoclostridium sp.]|nr:hypothetical protein [Thermoclostridium sp.]